MGLELGTSEGHVFRRDILRDYKLRGQTSGMDETPTPGKQKDGAGDDVARTNL